MKTAIVMRGKVRQLVLTPEDDTERTMLGVFADKEHLRTYLGRFEIEHCQGGWLREFPSHDSLLIVYNPENAGQ